MITLDRCKELNSFWYRAAKSLKGEDREELSRLILFYVRRGLSNQIDFTHLQGQMDWLDLEIKDEIARRESMNNNL